MASLRSSSDWRDLFARNATALRPIPWTLPVRWTPDERRTVAASIQEFQLGEQSEGRHLQRCADRYADHTGDAAYPEAIRLFIGEEARHATELARLLGQAGERLRTRSATDTAFRLIRKLGPGDGLELCLRVLVTAEVVATLYYAALRNATSCPVTAALCGQILRDEAAHVRFHAERLARLQATRSPWLRGLVRLGHHALMIGTAAVVWGGVHRRVLRRGDHCFRSFIAGCSSVLAARVLRVEHAVVPATDRISSSLSPSPIPNPSNP